MRAGSVRARRGGGGPRADPNAPRRSTATGRRRGGRRPRMEEASDSLAPPPPLQYSPHGNNGRRKDAPPYRFRAAAMKKAGRGPGQDIIPAPGHYTSSQASAYRVRGGQAAFCNYRTIDASRRAMDTGAGEGRRRRRKRCLQAHSHLSRASPRGASVSSAVFEVLRGPRWFPPDGAPRDDATTVSPSANELANK